MTPENYRKNHPEFNAIGKDVFSNFIIPLVKQLQDFVLFHVKPKYDDSCIFMYQIL